MSKPAVVVLGGLGFLGRRMVEFLVRENLADFIRVVDKAVKQTAYLDAAATAALADPRVTVIQANLASEAGVSKAMAPFPGDRQPEFVFNLAGESKYATTAFLHYIFVTFGQVWAGRDGIHQRYFGAHPLVRNCRQGSRSAPLHSSIHRSGHSQSHDSRRMLAHIPIQPKCFARCIAGLRTSQRRNQRS